MRRLLPVDAGSFPACAAGPAWLTPGLAHALPLLLLLAGCIPGGAAPSRPDLVWGRRGLSDGRLQKPRAMAIDAADCLYIADMTGRIQVFSADGEYLRGWSTPASENGNPTGLSFDRDGRLVVADTHYFRVLFYTSQGSLLAERTIGGRSGFAPGEFGFVTDCVQDARGNYYVAEYGENDRIQVFSATGQYLAQWGSHGSAPGQFIRPQSLTLDDRGQLFVADACNHRIQVFDVRGDAARLIGLWGQEGTAAGQLRYPYGLAMDDGGHVVVAEFGNHRVQKFSRDGRSLGVWGGQGRRDGQLYQPWSLVRDSRGRVHVLDTYNHRVQRIRW